MCILLMLIISELNERTQVLEAQKTSLEGQVSNVQGDLATIKAASEVSNLASAQVAGLEEQKQTKGVRFISHLVLLSSSSSVHHHHHCKPLAPFTHMSMWIYPVLDGSHV
jgi:hypothetical protein